MIRSRREPDGPIASPGTLLSILKAQASCLLFVVGMAAAAPAADAVRFELKFPPGRTLHWRSVTKSTIRQTAGGQTNTILVQNVVEMSEKVLQFDPAADLATLQYSYDAVKLRIDNQGQVREYDSARPEGEQLDAAEFLGFKALVGQWFTAKVSSDGRIQSVLGIDRLLRATLARIPESERLKVQPIVEQSVSVEKIKQLLAARYDVLPAGEGPIREGETWSRRGELAIGFVKLERTTRATLERADERKAVVSLEISLEQGTPRPVALPDGGSIEDRFAAAKPGTGEIEFDLVHGYPTRIRNVLQFRLATTLRDARGVTQPVDQQVDLTEDLTVRPPGAKTRGKMASER